MVLPVFSLLCLFSCFVCGPRFQIPHRGPESRCLVQWLRRQSCTNIFYFGKSQKPSVPHILSHLSHLRQSKSRNMLRALNMRGGGLEYLLSLFEHYLAADPLPLKSYMRPSAISLCHLNSKWLETACCLAHDLG